GSVAMSPGMAMVIVAVIVIILIVSWLSKRGGGDRANVAVDRGTADEGLAALRSQDPAFDGATFAQRAQGVMAKVNEAWVAGNMGPARRLISDGVYVRFGAQLALLKSQGLRNAMADW